MLLKKGKFVSTLKHKIKGIDQINKFFSNKLMSDEPADKSNNIIESSEVGLQVIKTFKIDEVYKVDTKKMGHPNPKSHVDLSRITNKNFKILNFSTESFNKKSITKENAVPISSKLGPFEINSPVMQDKTYHWCSCGMSKKQPYCDSSHKGTLFKPVSFKLAEKIEKMYLCGCKLSKRAPFCDGNTCLDLKEEEECELDDLIEKIKPNNEKDIPSETNKI